MTFTFQSQLFSKMFLSNTYREFPLAFQRNLCDLLETNEFGIENVFSCGNVSRCPIEKGYYIMCNWGPDYNKFPPLLVKGRYQVDLIFYGDGALISNFSWFMKIRYKNPALN
uniref:MD-2-related lipid-recognition domain-containing protein n=1 Tax=Photinus pyralis TaxID=7054 RepID=A0A1Y1LVZ8_PHOPY